MNFSEVAKAHMAGQHIRSDVLIEFQFPPALVHLELGFDDNVSPCVDPPEGKVEE